MWTSLLIGTVALGGVGGDGQEGLPAREAVIARMQYVLEEARSRTELAGLAVVVLSGDEVWWSKGFGWFDARAQRVARPEEPLAGGALLAPLVATAVLKLADREVLSLDDELGATFAELGGERAKVTVRQVLAHASGLPPCDAWLDARARAGKPPAREEVLAWLGEQALDFAPGTCVVYSASNVLLAGWLVECAAQKDFASFVREDLLADVELDALRRRHAPEDADAYEECRFEFRGERVSLGRAGALLGADELSASALDVARLARSLARGEVVSEEAWRELTAPFRLADGEATVLGMGLDVGRFAGSPTIGFGGSAYGASLHATYYADFDLAIALLAPGDAASLDLIERRLARVFLDVAAPEVLDLPLTDAEREVYLGAYYVGCNRALVADERGRLTLSLPERAPLRLFYQGSDVFVADRDPEVRARFEVREGRAERFVLEERGTRTVAVRID